MINGHGDDFQGELEANFSSNVWYGAENKALYEHLYSAMYLTTRYPEADAASLKIILANKKDVKPSQIVVCNGSTEAFYLIANAYAGSVSLIVSPTFSEYADACKMHQHTVHLSCREKLMENIEMLKPNLVWICNPNNPDGFCYSAKELKELMGNFPQSNFIIDQAYIDFTLNDPIFAAEINQIPNLILVHSLTKRYAIPGFRLGFLISNENEIHKIQHFCIPWSVNTLAIETGKYILANNTDEFPISDWLNDAKSLQQRINAISAFEICYSQTPYFLVKLLRGKASDLKAYLLNEKILVRNATNFDALPGEHIRICTLSAKKNELLINKLKEWSRFITR